MSGRQVRTISLSRELDQFVTAQVSSGHYSSASEVVRAGLRALVSQQGRAPTQTQQREN